MTIHISHERLNVSFKTLHFGSVPVRPIVFVHKEKVHEIDQHVNAFVDREYIHALYNMFPNEQGVLEQLLGHVQASSRPWENRNLLTTTRTRRVLTKPLSWALDAELVTTIERVHVLGRLGRVANGALHSQNSILSKIMLLWCYGRLVVENWFLVYHCGARINFLRNFCVSFQAISVSGQNRCDYTKCVSSEI